MMIAILEDVKGFRKSFAVPRFLPTIYIPIMKTPIEFYTAHVGQVVNEFAMEKITFEFCRWLEDHKVGLYKEIA